MERPERGFHNYLPGGVPEYDRRTLLAEIRDLRAERDSLARKLAEAEKALEGIAYLKWLSEPNGRDAQDLQEQARKALARLREGDSKFPTPKFCTSANPGDYE
jgi:hypothetical protein